VSKYKISIEEWDSMTIAEQEEYIKCNNIEIGYSTSIADTLTRGFGKLDWNGFWEYQCKQI